jgi:excisionase family DNA binding protein
MDLASQKYLTLAEAAEYLRFTPGALQKQMERKAIPAWTWKRVGRSYRFLRVALDEWLEEKYRAVRPAQVSRVRHARQISAASADLST